MHVHFGDEPMSIWMTLRSCFPKLLPLCNLPNLYIFLGLLFFCPGVRKPGLYPTLWTTSHDTTRTKQQEGREKKNNRGSPHPLGTSAPLIIVENSTCCLFQNHCLGAGTLKKKKQRRSKRIKETQVIFTLYLSVRRPLSLSLSQNWRLLLKFSLSVVTLTSRLQAGLSSGQRLKGKKS